MAKEILIALIAGSVSIVGAIFAWIQSWRMAGLNAQANLTLERLKSDTAVTLERFRADAALALEREKRRSETRVKAHERASREVAPLEAAITHTWQSLQTAKIHLLTIKALPYSDMQSVDARNALSAIGIEIPQAYSSLAPEMTREHGHELHVGSRRIAMLLVTLGCPVDSTDPSHESRPKIPTDEVIDEARERVTEFQRTLLGIKDQLRSARTEQLYAELGGAELESKIAVSK